MMYSCLLGYVVVLGVLIPQFSNTFEEILFLENLRWTLAPIGKSCEHCRYYRYTPLQSLLFQPVCWWFIVCARKIYLYYISFLKSDIVVVCIPAVLRNGGACRNGRSVGEVE